MAHKIGRNDLCPCGSGKKYKKCHLDAPIVPNQSKERDNVKKIVPFLARALKIESSSMCFCGSGKIFARCCGSESNSNPLFLEDALKTAEAYKSSQKGKVQFIPLGIWKQFEKASLNRFLCIYPGCQQKPIASHFIPENILRSNFGSYCKEYKNGRNALVWNFERAGVGKAGSLPLFCPHHDNNLFREIDTLQIDFSSEKQLFLFALRAMAFSLRRTQYLLGIDSQLIIITPIWIAKGPIVLTGTVPINIDPLQEQYIRYIANKEFFEKAIAIYESRYWGSFLYFHRSIPYQKALFFGGFLNPSHDLKGKKLNTSETAIAMNCNVFTKDNMLHVILSCPNGKSRSSYEGLFGQLASADGDIFITAINNFITVSADKPLLPETTSFSNGELAKIQILQKFAGECLRSKDKIFDLKNTVQAIKFV